MQGCRRVSRNLHEANRKHRMPRQGWRETTSSTETAPRGLSAVQKGGKSVGKTLWWWCDEGPFALHPVLRTRVRGVSGGRSEAHMKPTVRLLLFLLLPALVSAAPPKESAVLKVAALYAEHAAESVIYQPEGAIPTLMERPRSYLKRFLSPALLAAVLEEQRQTKPGEIRNLGFAGSRGCLRRHHAGQARRRGPGKPEISGQHGGVGIQDEASRKPVAGRRHPLSGSTPLVESDPAGLGAAPRRLKRSSPAACWQTEAGRPAKEPRSGWVQWICLTEAAAAG